MWHCQKSAQADLRNIIIRMNPGLSKASVFYTQLVPRMTENQTTSLSSMGDKQQNKTSFKNSETLPKTTESGHEMALACVKKEKKKKKAILVH